MTKEIASFAANADIAMPQYDGPNDQTGATSSSEYGHITQLHISGISLKTAWNNNLHPVLINEDDTRKDFYNLYEPQ